MNPPSEALTTTEERWVVKLGRAALLGAVLKARALTVPIDALRAAIFAVFD
jgi:hypothetical protein